MDFHSRALTLGSWVTFTKIYLIDDSQRGRSEEIDDGTRWKETISNTGQQRPEEMRSLWHEIEFSFAC